MTFRLWRCFYSGDIGNSIPSYLEISLNPPIFLRLCIWEISRVSGSSSGIGNGFPSTSLVLEELGYNTSRLEALHCTAVYNHSLITISSLEMYQEIILKRGMNIELTP